MNAVGDPAGTGRGGTWRSTAWRNRHFLIAAAILAITWLGWDWAIAQLKWVTRKDPVPWTPAVKVDADCRLISFPDRLGPYVLVGDGEFEKELDGRPDGDVVLRQDVLDTLKINTSLDKDRLASRSGNWYMVRIYRDTRVESPSSPFRYWRLELYYYTGRLYQVPHVPDRCLVAGGATILPAAAERLVVNVPGADAPWNHAAFDRVGYEMTDRVGLDVRRYVQYYAFSLNGQPEVSWEKVRLELTKPWVRHCYFAKIQLAPTGPVSDFAEADRAVNEFLDMFMPAVAATWPMPSVVDKLNASSPSAP